MKPIDKQLTKEAIFQSIISDFTYPVIDPSGQVVWCKSNLPFEQIFERISADEALFDALKKSQGETFLFDKTLTAITIRQQYPAGRLFYDWLNKACFATTPLKYELSHDGQLLGGIARQLGISMGQFMQPDPASPVTSANLLQGELIDAFGRRVYEGMKRAGFKEIISLRNREIQSAISKSERYFGRLENNHSQLGIKRFELHYTGDPILAKLSVEENAQHFDDLISTLQDQDKSGAFVGYWWKRRYLPECGYGVHLIQFIDIEQNDQAKLSQNTREIWQKVTNGYGTVFELFQAPGNHRCWGANMINTPYCSPSPLNEVMKSIRMMLDGERYLRLEQNSKRSHWGMGALPLPITRSLALPDIKQVKSAFELAQESTSASSISMPLPALSI